MSKDAYTKTVDEFFNIFLVKQDWFVETIPSIKAVIFYGSRVKGLERSDSDYDLLVIMPKDIELNSTNSEYFYEHKQKVFNVVVRSVERLRRIAKENTDLLQQEVFRDSVLIWSSDTEVKSLLNEISKIK